jgi:hypothetical protein
LRRNLSKLRRLSTKYAIGVAEYDCGEQIVSDNRHAFAQPMRYVTTYEYRLMQHDPWSIGKSFVLIVVFGWLSQRQEKYCIVEDRVYGFLALLYMYKFIARADITRLMTLAIVIASLSLGLIVVILRSAFPEYCCIKGWEPYEVAQSLVNGHGYSFAPGHRWLSPIEESGYTVTAWVDPLYTFLLAGGMWLFGERHEVPMALFNVVCLGGTFILLAYAARRHSGAWACVLAVGMLALNSNYRGMGHLASSNFQMLCIMFSAVLVFSYVRTPTFKRAIVLGFVLGFTALACPTALYFLPATALLMLTDPSSSLALRFRHAALVVICGILVVAPWTIRNFYAFDSFVAVRNGGGQIAFVGVNALGETMMNSDKSQAVGPIWTSDSAWDAVAKIEPKEYRRQLERYQMAYARQIGGADYADMNEAQRDKWFMERVTEFIKNYPVVFIQLGAAKIWAFIKLFNISGIVVIVAALGGALLFLNQPAIRIVASWCALYSAVFILAVPYFVRYRTPIEPLFSLLAAVFLVRCGRLIAHRWPKDTPVAGQSAG